MRCMGTLAACCLLLFSSCTNGDEVLVPEHPGFSLPAGVRPLTAATRSSLEGVFAITEGTDAFGGFVALKWSYVACGGGHNMVSLDVLRP